MALQDHKKKIIAGGIFLFLFAMFFAAPFALRPGIEMALRSKGFPKASVGQISFTPDGIFIDNIALDPNGFSLIDDIQVSGHWSDLIFKTKAEKISVKNIELSGEIDKANRIVIAGWDGGLKTASTDKIVVLPFNSLYVDGATLDLDTPAGAIRLQGKAALEKMKSVDERLLNATLWSSQKQLTVSLNLQGKLNKKSEFSGKAEIADGSIDIDPISLSRLSGWLEFKSGSNRAVSGQIMAGGMKYKDIPFEDVNFAFDTSQDSRAVFKTKVTGRPVIIESELTSVPKNALNVTVSAPSLGMITSIFKNGPAEQKNIYLDDTGPVEIKSNLGTDAISGPEMPFDISLAFPSRSIEISASLVYDRIADNLAAKLTPVTLKAYDIATMFSLQDANDLSLDKGDVLISGGFNWNLSTKPSSITGPLDLEFKKINAKFSDYTIENINGRIGLKKVLPLQTLPRQEILFSTLLAGKTLKNGKLVFDGDEGQINIHDFKADLAGGKFILQPSKWDMDAAKNTFSIQLMDIQLGDLVEKSSSLKAQGKINGVIPMRLEEKNVFISNALLSSVGPGSFRYLPEKLPDSLQGDDPRMKTVRMALSDYRYDTLQITIDGPLNGNLKTTLKASGKSPIFEDRQVNLNLNLEGALAAALKQALQPGALAGRIQQRMDDRR